MVIVLIIVLSFWVISLFGIDTPGSNRRPVPTDVPPAAAVAPPAIDVHGPGRTSDLLAEWAEPIAEDTNMDPQAVRAYGNAALIAAEAWPGCNLQWNTLAGIGWVETRHGTYTGKLFDAAELDANGVVVPPIVGPALDGTQGFARILDTDNGHFDNDTEFDRAVGPMQFIPESWNRFGRDANGDGYADPQQIDDAALGAANLLCSGGRDLSTAEDWQSAILGYNHSNDYLARVRDAAANYALRQAALR
ncbi:lytic transglycosylase domain-containing protein [Corynebacterium meitnerae]|uniref:Lytic murein transglycosylase n=1 Tax=Corynebacterium meitnerae TaxID=2913498 RepID=A0A9X3LUG6_9CORY|nr:lytic murein transglycosylase [Corynebacterium meitnerae]MCZ9293395.1 lytic murein transglycosylase [Corynebacterium meitnerae]